MSASEIGFIVLAAINVICLLVIAWLLDRTRRCRWCESKDKQNSTGWCGFCGDKW